jgi:hypothetical protein
MTRHPPATPGFARPKDLTKVFFAPQNQNLSDFCEVVRKPHVTLHGPCPQQPIAKNPNVRKNT